MKIEHILDSQMPRVKIKAFLKKFPKSEVTTAQEIARKVGVDRRTAQSALEDFCRFKMMNKIKINGKNYYGFKDTIKKLENEFKTRYGAL